jgi:hypothetical protein
MDEADGAARHEQFREKARAVPEKREERLVGIDDLAGSDLKGRDTSGNRGRHRLRPLAQCLRLLLFPIGKVDAQL